MVRIGWASLALTLMLLAGCDPPYLADTYAASTPLLKSFDTSELARMPVAVLAFVAPGNLQSFSPTLSQALSGALTEVNPPIREISTDETLNRLTDRGLGTEYADLRAGFARDGILGRARLRRIGSGLGAQYVMLPGIALHSLRKRYLLAAVKNRVNLAQYSFRYPTDHRAVTEISPAATNFDH
jgi:hypothetical protein